MNFWHKLLLSILIGTLAHAASAQELSRGASRYEIDIKRQDLEFNDREALFRSREFIRLDPTYYVGHMYEAMFKFERASDYVGFRNAIPPLKKSLSLLEKDFTPELRKQYTDEADYQPIERVRLDYLFLTDALMDCYSNLEQPDSVYRLLNHYKSWNFQSDMLGANNYLAWTFHRHRFYTSAKYSFLGNSIEENDKIAYSYLYKAKAELEKNRELNESVLGEMRVLGEYLGICHYLALIHSYERNTDSAAYYYRQMEGYNIFPFNNFGIFRFTDGNFYEAESYFRYALIYDYGDKRIKESEYFLGLLAIYQAKPDEAITRHKQQIQQMGVVPGWGWINVALARAYLYNGQLDKAEEHLKKARNFKELHIGSTWTQNHYDVSISSLELLNKIRRHAAIKFENQGYWYSPASLAKLLQVKLEKNTQQLLLINNLATNPEREEVFYRIFSSESTVSFDEVWHMIRDYGQNFFLKKFSTLAETDERESIRKYFQLFTAKLLIDKGDKQEAGRMLRKILAKANIDGEYEKLFVARTCEALAQCTGKQDDVYNFYEAFPQLVPFSEDITMRFRMRLFDDDSNLRTNVVKLLKEYKIEWAGENDREAPVATIYFSKDGKKNVAKFSVKLADGSSVVREATLSAPTESELARQLAYGLFNILEPSENTENDLYF